MMEFVLVLKPTKNGDGRLHRGFLDLYGLEATLESRILSNRLTILVRYVAPLGSAYLIRA